MRLLEKSEDTPTAMVHNEKDGVANGKCEADDPQASMASPVKRRKQAQSQAWEWEEVEIDIGWGNLRGKARGTGPRLMLGVHGWLDNANTFDLIAPMIPDDVRFISLDLPGHGLSDHFPPGFIYDPRGYAGAIKKAVTVLGWKRFIYLGHSMGAVVGILYTSIFPEDIEAFISIDIIKTWSLKPEKYASELKKYYLSYFDNETKSKQPALVYQEEELLQKTIDGSKSLNEEGAKILLKRGAKKAEDGKGLILRRDLRAKAFFIGFLPFEVWVDMATSIKCPLLFLKATDGHYYESKDKYDIMRSAFNQDCKHFSYYEIEGKHHIHLTNPDEVGEYVLAFLKECMSLKISEEAQSSS
ncbi:serine hydrolase-like protein 2 isoform X1 [Penaeus indicus]|uniref:serine hydrolase-like protein 2 isoform X1 n=2 Tax=Penaeus indicus TaxID=29960 RepID=UPI00300D39FB